MDIWRLPTETGTQPGGMCGLASLKQDENLVYSKMNAQGQGCGWTTVSMTTSIYH